MADFGELKTLNPRVAWPNEARDFTPWLAANITKLGEALDMQLEVTAVEADVGDFCLDILARDLNRDRPVVIENQFGATDHPHLGQLLTYAAGLDASAVIWVAEKIREEHREALEWLNRRTDAETHFFAVVVEVIQIDNSRPAFRFKPVVFPNEWQKAVRDSAEQQASPRGESYRRYFQVLIDELREKHHFTGARVGQAQNWYSFTSGINGFYYGTSFAQGGRIRVEIYVDLGNLDWNKATFDALFSQRDAIESKFGEPLEWERLDNKRASRIAVYREGTIDDHEERLAEIRVWAIERLLKFKRVFGPRLVELRSKSVGNVL
jgi:hypothetical protein